MTATAQATPLRAFVLEPFELAISQPHQFLISSASVSIVALEAGTLVPPPFNILLAIGAEWAYLRGFITGVGVKTRWASALNWAAVILVFGYGTLWGLRSFHLIPEAPAPWLAVLLTMIHIGAIGAVTICSAMLHRAVVDAQAAVLLADEERTRAIEEQATAERRMWELAQEEEDRKLARWEQAQRLKSELKIAEQAADGTMRSASPKMRRDALGASMDAAEQTCPNCGASIPSRSTWLAARRWGHCSECKGKE